MSQTGVSNVVPQVLEREASVEPDKEWTHPSGVILAYHQGRIAAPPDRWRQPVMSYVSGISRPRLIQIPSTLINAIILEHSSPNANRLRNVACTCLMLLFAKLYFRAYGATCAAAATPLLSPIRRGSLFNSAAEFLGRSLPGPVSAAANCDPAIFLHCQVTLAHPNMRVGPMMATNVNILRMTL
ncbi:hypothetical protein An09g01730 [Aspergillus niger]|uniref:Uncharacterized protein n=2 Tax=Aspergillus niger TaxID=5061 RepID=A2QTD7_ASPNC|nr:hypothetical protein An09g01730 [Aspergillus niger]CAK49093.1 hypothetical protein An09g01730 [Aspergillus niger]